MSFGTSLIENDGHRAGVVFLLAFVGVLAFCLSSSVTVISSVLYAATVGVVISVASLV
ncbi:hypothetical protein [Halocatena halophila]|uniref:hypothetical protein n=1 Tax=Halocatena halophila TaxID=2814576 RepID=UPI002ED39EC1